MRLRIGAIVLAIALVGFWWLSRGTANPANTAANTGPTTEASAGTSRAPVSPASSVQSGSSSSAAAQSRPSNSRSLDISEAAAVAASFAGELETWDTTTDTSPLDASRRASRYATPALSARLQHEAPPPAQAWTALAARQARTTVTTTTGGLGTRSASSADTATTAVRAVTVSITDRASGWTADGGTAAFIVRLTRTGAGQIWSVSSYHFTA